jgi:hypothetical protein
MLLPLPSTNLAPANLRVSICDDYRARDETALVYLWQVRAAGLIAVALFLCGPGSLVSRLQAPRQPFKHLLVFVVILPPSKIANNPHPPDIRRPSRIRFHYRFIQSNRKEHQPIDGQIGCTVRVRISDTSSGT